MIRFILLATFVITGCSSGLQSLPDATKTTLRVNREVRHGQVESFECLTSCNASGCYTQCALRNGGAT